MGHCWTRLCGSATDNELIPGELASGNVHLITTIQNWDDMLSDAKRDGKTVVANFSASWCAPCRVIASTYCELADRYPSIMFLIVDVDMLPEFSNSWGIKATPTFYFLENGRQVDKLVGANKQELQRKTAAVADSTTKSNGGGLMEAAASRSKSKSGIAVEKKEAMVALESVDLQRGPPLNHRLLLVWSEDSIVAGFDVDAWHLINVSGGPVWKSSRNQRHERPWP